MGFEHHPEAAALHNPFKQHLRLIEANPAIGHAGNEATLQRVINGLHAEKTDWHYGCNLSIGSLGMEAAIGLSVAAVVDTHHQPTVLLGYDGKAILQHGEGTWQLHSGDCIIVSGQNTNHNQSITWIGNHYSIVAFRLDRQRLLQTVKRMGVGTAAAMADSLPLDHVVHLSPSASREQIVLHTMMREAIEKANQLLNINPILLEKLQIDDQIYRILAVILVPDLAEESPFDRVRLRERQGRDAFDDLLDYIKINLDQPLNLTLLESRSHYSRRALQYAFRERLGCTATQWIRSQRLDLARKLLEHPRPEDTVASIAMASGYRSLSLFSVDFQQRFHLKPSDLLREARSSRAQDHRPADPAAPSPLGPEAAQSVDTRAPQP